MISPPRRVAATLAFIALIASGARTTANETLADTAEPDTRFSVELLRDPHEPERPIEPGDLIGFSIVVETPPDHTLLPIPRTGLSGLRVIRIVATPAEHHTPDAWRYRTHVRVQALEGGEGVWPEMTLEVEDAKGDRHSLSSPELRVAIGPGSILHSSRQSSRQPARQRPFGLRHPHRDRTLPTFLLALGVTLAAALVAWVGLRRRAASAREPSLPEQPRRDTRSRAEAQLVLARSLLATDPREASNLGASLLRDFMAERFDASLRAATTGELQSAAPSEAVRPHWQAFVQLLGRYDSDRFQSHAGSTHPDALAERVRSCLDDTAGFLVAVDEAKGTGERRNKGQTQERGESQR